MQVASRIPSAQPTQVPLGKHAFFPGQLYHTNEVLLRLGTGATNDTYFASATAGHARQVLDARAAQLGTWLWWPFSPHMMGTPRHAPTEQQLQVAQLHEEATALTIGGGRALLFLDEAQDARMMGWDEQGGDEGKQQGDLACPEASGAVQPTSMRLKRGFLGGMQGVRQKEQVAGTEVREREPSGAAMGTSGRATTVGAPPQNSPSQQEAPRVSRFKQQRQQLPKPK